MPTQGPADENETARKEAVAVRRRAPAARWQIDAGFLMLEAFVFFWQESISKRA